MHVRVTGACCSLRALMLCSPGAAAHACMRPPQAVHCGTMRRYQGLDWRDRRNWGCNNKRSPVGQGLFEGGTLSIFDLLFVKVKASLIAAGDTTAQLAVKHTQWMSGSERLAGT